MKTVQRRTAIKALAALALGAFCSLALAAQVAGTVVSLSGPLMAKKGDGTVKLLAIKSEVEQGDTLVSEKNTFAQIRFVDNSEMMLKPNTTFKIETFAYDAGKPEGDSASFNLVKGGLRSITGLLGKRNKEKFQLKTPTATIGIRGTTFTADYIAPSEEQMAAAREAWLFASTAGAGAGAAIGPPPGKPGSGPPNLAPGLYVHVIDGAINVSNPAGAQVFTVGQFGFTSSFTQPPVALPNDPGLQFTPPPSFSNTNENGGGDKSDAIDCEVR